MKKMILLTNIVLLSFMLFACNQGSISISTSIGDGTAWPGCVKISLADKVYDLDENINVYFSYGHDYIQDAAYHGVLSHYFVLYVIDGSQTHGDPENGIILYEDLITGDDLLSDDYRCDPGKWIWSKVEYVNAYDVSIDFLEFDFDSGLLVVRFYETFNMQDNIDGEIVLTETTHYNETFIYFMKDNGKIEFSQRSFG